MEQRVYTREQIEAMQDVDVRTVDPSDLRDIRDVKVNTDLPKRERILDFIRQIGNPLLLPAREVCGEGQLHRHGCDPGGPDALLHTLQMLTQTFLQNTLDIAGKLC